MLKKSFFAILAIFAFAACSPVEDACPGEDTQYVPDAMNLVKVQFFGFADARFYSLDEMGYGSVRNLENNETRFRAQGFYGEADDFSVTLPLNLNNENTTYVFGKANGFNSKDTIRFFNYDPHAEFKVEKCRYEAETSPIQGVSSTYTYFQYDSFDDSLNYSVITFVL